MEECVAPEPTRFEILVHADQIACLPQMHYPMHLIDQRSGLACGGAAIAIIAHALANSPVPGAEADFAAGAFFDLGTRVLGSGFADSFIFELGLAAGLLQYLV